MEPTPEKSDRNPLTTTLAIVGIATGVAALVGIPSLLSLFSDNPVQAKVSYLSIQPQRLHDMTVVSKGTSILGDDRLPGPVDHLTLPVGACATAACRELEGSDIYLLKSLYLRLKIDRDDGVIKVGRSMTSVALEETTNFDFVDLKGARRGTTYEQQARAKRDLWIHLGDLAVATEASDVTGSETHAKTWVPVGPVAVVVSLEWCADQDDDETCEDIPVRAPVRSIVRDVALEAEEAG